GWRATRAPSSSSGPTARWRAWARATSSTARCSCSRPMPAATSPGRPCSSTAAGPPAEAVRLLSLQCGDEGVSGALTLVVVGRHLRRGEVGDPDLLESLDPGGPRALAADSPRVG